MIKRKKKQTQWERYSSMSPEQLRKETARFDKELVIDEARPASAKQQKLVDKFYQKAGRPKHGRSGVKTISVTVEKHLLSHFDRVAKTAATPVKRSELLAKAMREYIAANG